MPWAWQILAPRHVPKCVCLHVLPSSSSMCMYAYLFLRRFFPLQLTLIGQVAATRACRWVQLRCTSDCW